MRMEAFVVGAKRALLAVGFAIPAFMGSAHAATDLVGAIRAGTPLIDLRMRYETVDQANKPLNANAYTFRARIGYQTGQYYGFSALAEFDFLQHLGPRRFFDTYRSDPALFPTVPDPDMTALNRLQLTYAANIASPMPDTQDLRIGIGRQRVAFGDQRFVGNVAWRQHEQTMDGITLNNTSIPGLNLNYAYVTRVNRVFGPDSPIGTFDSHSHLFNAAYRGLPYVRLEAFAYLLDLRQSPAQSTETFGFRADGTIPLGAGVNGILNGGYSWQGAYAKNPNNVDLSYYVGEAGFGYKGATAIIGYEVLEGNGIAGFSTPLATLHIFQGWADVFLTTPANGIKDFYAKAAYTLPVPPLFTNVTATAFYHDFSAERISGSFGHEWDVQVEGAVDTHVTVGAKFAAFQGGSLYPDKNVGWLYVGYRF